MNSGDHKSGASDEETRRRPGPIRESSHSVSAIEWLENRVYKTYGARRESAKRLQSRSTSWSAALVSTALASTLVAIVLLVEPRMIGEHGDVLLVLLGMLTLVSSLMVANRNYDVRSLRAFDDYRKLQRLATVLEARISGGLTSDPTSGPYKKFDAKYQEILDSSENHTPADYYRSSHPILRGTRSASSAGWKRETDVVGLIGFVVRWIQVVLSVAGSAIPWIGVAAPVCLLIPVVIWIFGG